MAISPISAMTMTIPRATGGPSRVRRAVCAAVVCATSLGLLIGLLGVSPAALAGQPPQAAAQSAQPQKEVKPPKSRHVRKVLAETHFGGY